MPQQDLAYQTAMQHKTIYDVLNGNCSFEDAIKDTKIDNLKLVSSNVDLSGLEVETASMKIEELFC